MKRVLITLVLLLLIFATVVVGWFSGVMNRSFVFAQKQAQACRSYMDGMNRRDFEEITQLSLMLMSEPAPEGVWHSMSDFDKEPVPTVWRERGVLFIRYRPDWVSLGWHGGPHAHSHLEVKREDDGTLVFTAHYTDNEPERILKRISKAQQASTSKGG